MKKENLLSIMGKMWEYVDSSMSLKEVAEVLINGGVLKMKSQKVLPDELKKKIISAYKQN